MRKVSLGAFFALLPHMEGLYDYEMPQKVAQNDGLTLLLNTVCHTCHKKILSLLKNPTCAEMLNFARFWTNLHNPFWAHFRRGWTNFTGFWPLVS